MLWEVEIFPKGHDGERLRVAEEYDLLTHGHGIGAAAIAKTSHGFLLQGELAREQIERLMNELLFDPVAELGELHGANDHGELASGGPATVLRKPGVMDPVAMSVLQTARDLGIALLSAHTFRRYYWTGKPHDRAAMYGKVLCNDAIERVIEQPILETTLGLGSRYTSSSASSYRSATSTTPASSSSAGMANFP